MEYHYEILPKEMRVTDRIFWDSAASFYGDICDYLNSFGEVTTVGELMRKISENSIAELMLQEIYDQWQQIKKIPKNALCTRKDWEEAGYSLEGEEAFYFKKAFDLSTKDTYPYVSVRKMMKKTEIQGVYEMLMVIAKRYEKEYAYVS